MSVREIIRGTSYRYRLPTGQNGYIERLNGSLRSELLNAYVFRTPAEVRHKAGQWMLDYNWRRSHSLLGYKTPMELIT